MADTTSEPLFRTAKRRKVFRTRIDHDDNGDKRPESIDAATPPVGNDNLRSQDQPGDQDIEQGVASSHRLTQRRIGKARKGGISFAKERTTTRTPLPEDQPNEVAVVDAPNALSATASRFMAQTGQKVEADDQVMMAYIDSQMAKMRAAQAQNPDQDMDDDGPSSTISGSTLLPHRQAVSTGRIEEIDLGPDATSRNTARTEAAARRLMGEIVEEEETPRRGKVRLGRDGKPRRRRNRRGSDDIKRDALVEAVMKESRIEMYDEPAQSEAVNHEQNTDEALEERFRQEFLDAMQNRDNKRKLAATAANKGKVEEKGKGPKLGGSRSTRAKYHAQEKAAAAAAKKSPP